MISNQHYIELYVNKQLVELESQDSLNLRINNILFNPTKTTTTQSEYSYSFDIPSTATNNKIFDYANNLSKLNKFRARYPAQVYADGILIFNGSLTIQKYKNGKYTCNLVSIKVNSLEEIFEDEKLTDLKWMVDFDGAPTINTVNNDLSSKYFFPFVSYGVFQKDYVSIDSVSATYTAKKKIDTYNNWWIETFYPSLNVVETMKRAFESKGYNVIGSVFSDPYINNIYASCNLAQEQAPTYNLGNPKFGRLNLTLSWDNYQSANKSPVGGKTSTGDYLIRYSTGGFPQDLKFPYYKINPAINASNRSIGMQYNYDSIVLWNMMDSRSNPSGVTLNLWGDSYIYDPKEMLIVIPEDGWYKIDLYVHCTLSGATQPRTVSQWTNTFYEDDEFTKRDVVISGSNATFGSYLPLEVQLVRNYNNDVELIKGKKNVKYESGDPNQIECHYEGGSYTSSSFTNKSEWDTEFPHQDSYGSELPTKQNELIASTLEARNQVVLEYGGKDDGITTTTGGRRVSRNGPEGGRIMGGEAGASKYNTYGFMHKPQELMVFDQAVSSSFICGISTMGEGQTAVMRNGTSWSKLSSTNNHIFANVAGYNLHNKNSSGGTDIVETAYCANEYKFAPSSVQIFSNDNVSSNVSCCVYLNKNDRLELMAIQRDYEYQAYSTSAYCSININAMSQRSEADLRADENWDYTSQTEFPTQLNLFNFTNNETKISDWISNVQKAFNLEIIQQGNTVEINTNRGVKKTIDYAVDIDDRVNSDEVESQYISYPKTMAVKYKTDIDEYGFELTVPQSHINDIDWYKYGDSGYTIIQLNDDTYETSSQETQTNFSYTYYMDFDFYQIQSDGTSATTADRIRIPVIEKSEYMAEGYGYDEAMKHDGYSFSQRFWYRQAPSQQYVWLSSVLSNGTHEYVNLVYPLNYWLDFNLSYKDTEKSLVSEYFNVSPMLASNYVNVDVYLTPQEYMDLKNGALCKMDRDLYYVSEIGAYDPSGFNLTTLKLMKKVV